MIAHLIWPSPDLAEVTQLKSTNFNFISDYNIKTYNSQRLEAGNNHIDKYMVKAAMSKQNLESIVKDLTIKDFDPLKKTVLGSFGLQSNSYITEEEGKTNLIVL